MGKRKYFNKGVLKGTVVRSEVVEYESKNGKGKGRFLSMEVNTGDGNRIKATVFNNASNPTKAQDLHDQFPVNSKVDVSGNVRESEFTTKSGRKGLDRSVSVMSVKTLKDDTRTNGTFIIQGDVEKIRETEDGSEITVRLDTSYEDKTTKKRIEREERFTLNADTDVTDELYDLDVNKGCNAKFKGVILNRLEFDDYGDIIANVQMFKVEKVEDVLQPDDIEDEEDLPFDV
jgi:hypothetical protein